MTGIPTVSMDGVPDPLPDDLAVLDCREPVEWAHGHIEGAVHIPMNEIPDRLAEVPEGQLLVVCKVGGRSAQVTGYLLQQGRDAVNLDGGMLDWEAAGRDMVSETGQPTAGVLTATVGGGHASERDREPVEVLVAGDLDGAQGGQVRGHPLDVEQPVGGVLVAEQRRPGRPARPSRRRARGGTSTRRRTGRRSPTP